MRITRNSKGCRGVAKLVKALDFDSGIEGSNPSSPANVYTGVAQLVERSLDKA